MRRTIIYSLSIVVSLILEAGIFVQYRPYGVIPDLLLIIFICGALTRGSLFGVKVGITVGIIQDLLVGNFGVSILINIFIAYLVGVLEGKVVKEQILVPIFITFFATFVHELLYLFLSERLILSIPLLWALRAKILPLAFVNALCVIPYYYVLYRLERKISYY